MSNSNFSQRLARLEAVAEPKQHCQCPFMSYPDDWSYQRAIAGISPDSQEVTEPDICPHCDKPSGALPIKIYVGIDLERV